MTDPRTKTSSENDVQWFVRRLGEIGHGGVATDVKINDQQLLHGMLIHLIVSNDEAGETKLSNDGITISVGNDPSKLKPWTVLKIVGKAVVSLLAYEPTKLTVTVPDGMDPTFVVKAVSSALLRCDDHKTGITYLGPAGVEIVTKDADVAKVALEETYASNIARWLTCAPPNRLTIDVFADMLLTSLGVLADVVVEPTEEEYARMGLLNAVAAANGGNRRVITMTFHPISGETEKHNIYVGKTIIFDQGGVCSKLKHSLGMKGDNGGGDSVYGIAWYIANNRELLTETVIFVWTITDNLVDREACIPDGIYTAYNGKTVEMINTDAEGRLACADAAMWAAEKFNLGEKDSICFVCTLTGAVSYALGKSISGLHVRNSFDNLELIETLECAGFNSGDPVGNLHSIGEADEILKCDVADIANSHRGNPNAGSSQGFAFMTFFIDENILVMEIDIAGKAGDFGDSDYQKGTANPAGVWWAIERERTRSVA